VPDLMVQLDELAQRDSDEMIDRLKTAHSLDNIEHHCWNIDGEISDSIGDFIHDHRIDLLIVGTRGRTGLSKFLFGSIALEIFQRVSCPVLTLGPWARRASRNVQVNKVLVATDLSRESKTVIPYALVAANTWHAQIDVLHVCSCAKSDCRQGLEDFGGRLKLIASGEAPLSVRTHLLGGMPSQTVLDFARQNSEDLIVLGVNRHRSLYAGPAVSHAYEIVRQARCPVLSVCPA
jgi:nucleotide-binding universal stress UspA family protein